MDASPGLTHCGQDKKEKHYYTGVLGQSKCTGWAPLQGSYSLFLEGLFHGDSEGHPAHPPPPTCNV